MFSLSSPYLSVWCTGVQGGAEMGRWKCPPGRTGVIIIIFFFFIVIFIIIITRPKPAYGRHGLAGSWGQDTDEVNTFLVFLTSHFAPAALSSDLTNLGPLTMESDQKPWNHLEKPLKPTKNYEKPQNPKTPKPHELFSVEKYTFWRFLKENSRLISSHKSEKMIL